MLAFDPIAAAPLSAFADDGLRAVIVEAPDVAAATIALRAALTAVVTESPDVVVAELLGVGGLRAIIVEAPDVVTAVLTRGVVVVLVYPPLPQMAGTKPQARGGLRPRYATDGSVRVRRTSSRTRFDLVLHHAGLTETELQTLLDFEVLARAKTFFHVDYLAEGIRADFVFAEGKPFDIRPAPGPQRQPRYDVNVNLVRAD